MAWVMPGFTFLRSIRDCMVSFSSTYEDESGMIPVTPGAGVRCVTDGLGHSSIQWKECKATRAMTATDWGEATFEAHRPLLFSIAYRMLGSASEAEDVVQDA